MLGIVIASSLGFAADEVPDRPAPTHGVVLNINAYGDMLTGHVIVDADKLAALGVTLMKEQLPLTGTQVPLAHGIRVLGLEIGERQVQDAIDSLMYFNSGDDPYLDASDPGFAALYLFVDANADAAIQKAEVRSLAEIGVDSVSRFGDIRMKER